MSSQELEHLYPCLHPDNEGFKNIEKRLETFCEWPHLFPTPHALATAGMYYVKKRDKVRCYYCGGGLHNWKPEDDPWEEHAKYFPHCENLLRQKGFSYVHTINQRNKLVRLSDRKLGRNIPAGIIIRDFDVAEIDPRMPFPPSSSCTSLPHNDQSIIEFPLTRRKVSNSSTSRPIGDKSQSFENPISNSSSKNQCRICCAAEMNALLLPCTHILSCLNCACRFKNDGCPICCTAILTVEKVTLG